MKVVCSCAFCGKKFKKDLGQHNYSIKRGLKEYCTRKHFGLDRRDNKTKAQRKAEKSEYDKIYCAKNKEKKQAAAKEYFKKDYATNPEKYRKWRKRRYKDHLKYLSTPEYKKWKQQYDKKYLAKRDYGVFWECSLLLAELELWLLNNTPDGMKFQMGITNKTQKRKRLWSRTKKQQQKNSLQRA